MERPIELIELENQLQKKTEMEQVLLKEIERLSTKVLHAEQQRSHFLSNILNEINNPLTSILGLSKSIMHAAYDNAELVHKQANLVFEEAFDLDYQMRNIFAAAKIEAGLLSPKPGKVNLNKLVINLLNDFQFKVSKKKLNLQVELDPETPQFYCTDAALLFGILINLIGNAIEFSPIGSTISIKGQMLENEFYITIKDDGNGISDEDQLTIFERFRQLDFGPNKLHRGNGLGLSVVKEYVDVIGGSLRLESSKGRGSTFYLAIPSMEHQKEQTAESKEVIFGEEELF